MVIAQQIEAVAIHAVEVAAVEGRERGVVGLRRTHVVRDRGRRPSRAELDAARIAHAGTPGREPHDLAVASATRSDPVSTTRAPCESTSTARPVSRPLDVSTTTLGASSYRRRGSGPARATRLERDELRVELVEERREQRDARDRRPARSAARWRRPRSRAASPATPVDVDPDADHRRGDPLTVESSSRPAGRRASRRRATRGRSATQAHCGVLRTRGPGGQAAATASCQATPAPPRPHGDADHHVPARGECHERPRRPRPAVCSSATTRAPRRPARRAAPWPGRSGSRSFGDASRRADPPSRAIGAAPVGIVHHAEHTIPPPVGRPRSVGYTRRRHEPDPRRP